MDEFLSPHARSVLLGDRRCTATNRRGERCGRASALGQFVCDHHGAKAPLSKQAARERLLTLMEPAVDVLYRATRQAPPCAVCGRSDADRDPTAVRAAGMILDRCGLGPQMQVEVTPSVPDASDLSPDELVTRAEVLLEEVRAYRDRQRGATIDGYLVPENDEATDAVIPSKLALVIENAMPGNAPEAGRFIAPEDWAKTETDIGKTEPK